MSLGHLPPRLSDAEALALGRLIEPELHAALVTVDAHGADLQLPKVRLGYAGHLQALRWIRREPEPQAVRHLQPDVAVVVDHRWLTIRK